MKIVSGSSNQHFANSLAAKLGIPTVAIDRTQFSNGEKKIQIKERIQGENIALVQSFSQPVDEHIMEFLLIADALERAGARHINLILPWMGYSLQDKAFQEGEPIAAKVVADLISNAYIKRVFLLDLHNTSIPGFFSIPTQHLSPLTLFEQYIRTNLPLEQAVVVSPDFGGLKRARVLADMLNVPLANIDKHRDENGAPKPMGVSGSVEGKNCIVYDDIINSGGTVVEVARFLKSEGAKSVHFVVTHGIFANNGAQAMTDSSIDSIAVTDSIYHKELPQNIKVLETTELFATHIAQWI